MALTTRNDNRLTAKQVDYMELTNARKDGDCKKVKVRGGISLQLGCCNIFDPEGPHVQTFRCGSCEYRIMRKPDVD